MFGNKIKLELRHHLALLEGMPSQYTPDIARLEKYEDQKLFVTDEWMSDRRQNFIIDEIGKREGVAFTKHPYLFRVFTGFLSPEWTPVVEVGEGFKVKGEIVSIPPSAFLLLDKLKQNGLQFVRKRVDLIKPYRDGPIVFENTTEERSPHHTWTGGIDWMHGKFPYGHPLAGKKCWVGPERIRIVHAWMYLGKPAFWNQYRKNPYLFQKVPTFKPKKDKEWLSEYYKYQNPDNC